MRIAIFGGSFDPPHIGHEKIAKKVLKKLNIDKLIVIPSFLNPLKTSSFLEANTRYKLLKKIFKGKKKVKVSNYEVKQNRPVYSIETIKYMKKKYKADKIYLIIGADNYNSFHLWSKYKKIKKLVKIVVITRNGFKYKKTDDIKRLKIHMKISSSELRKEFNPKYIPKKIKKDVKKVWQKKAKIE